MNRRRALRTLGLGLAGAALPGCAGAVRPGSGAGGRPVSERALRRFPAVRVERERVIRTVVGLRPYRPSGFVVRPQRLGDTLVVHNYGHGGGGVTLSWGTSDLAVRHALESEERDVAVLGCGAVGLATARLLQRAGRNVTIYARDLPPRTTSNVAGAQFSPFSVFDQGETSPAFDRDFLEATRLSYRHFQDFLGPEYGVRFAENLYLGSRPYSPADWMAALPDVFSDIRPVPREEHGFDAPYATSITTLFIEPTRYLRATLEDVRIAGGRVVVRELGSVDEVVALSERVVMNCTGLGARALFGDDELMPVKGQLTVLRPQKDVDYLLLSGGLYMFPRSDGILLGGTFQRGDWTLEPDREAERRVLEGHERLFSGRS